MVESKFKVGDQVKPDWDRIKLGVKNEGWNSNPFEGMGDLPWLVVSMGHISTSDYRYITITSEVHVSNKLTTKTVEFYCDQTALKLWKG